MNEATLVSLMDHNDSMISIRVCCHITVNRIRSINFVIFVGCGSDLRRQFREIKTEASTRTV